MISDSAFERLQNIRYIYLEGFSSRLLINFVSVNHNEAWDTSTNQHWVLKRITSQLDLSLKFENLNQKIIKLKLSIHLGFWESLMIRPIIFLEYLSKIIQSHATAIWKNWVFMLGNCLILNWERALDCHQVFKMLFKSIFGL